MSDPWIPGKSYTQRLTSLLVAVLLLAGGSCKVTVNPNGTLVIPEQYFCETDYIDGYKIKGSGTWDNCGAKPTMKIDYDIWFPEDGFWIAAKYGASYLGGKTVLTANLTQE